MRFSIISTGLAEEKFETKQDVELTGKAIMKLVKAYIRQRMVDDVYRALNKAGHCCMTLVECTGTGSYSDHEKQHISDKYPFADAYRVTKLEILAADEKIEQIVSLIKQHGRTGYSGDGMIIVSPVDEAYKIRNDEKGILSI